MKRFRSLLCLGLISACAFGIVTSAYGQPLPKDDRIIEGKLDNGLTWKYFQHDNPPGKMAIIIHVNTGSLNETEEQRGIAHFIEHMAFNGTEHFGPGELIEYFEGIGMEFGADLNAFTSFDQTAYMLFTPNTEVEQVDKALLVLSDYVFRASFLPEEIENERGVIISEWRSGKGPFERIRDKLAPQLYENSRFAKRLIIGTYDTILSVKQKDFFDFYRTWYRPDRMTLVMVGDAPVEKFMPSIEKWFGQYKPENPAKPIHTAGFTPFTKQKAIVVTEPELSHCSIEMVKLVEPRDPIRTYEQAYDQLVEILGPWMLNRRFDNLVKKGEASYLSASASTYMFYNDALRVSARASGDPADWAKMLEEVVIEVSRAYEHGFTAPELDIVLKEVMASAEHAVKTEPTRDAQTFLMEIMSAAHDKEIVQSAAQELELLKMLLPRITIDEVNKAFRKNYGKGSFAYVVQTPEKEELTTPTNEVVLAAANAAWARKTKAFAAEALPTEILEKQPTAGKVVEKSFDEDLKITSAWLDNGVRVHHRFMDYKKDQILINIGLAGGSIEETKANSGVTELAALAINRAATSRLSSSNIRDMMAGKNIGVAAGGGGDALDISVSGAPEDLEVGLQLAHALLVDGKLEQAAFDNWKTQSLQRMQMLQQMPQFRAFKTMRELATGNDPRMRLIFQDKENLEALSVEKTEKWLKRLSTKAPIEVTIVGDMQYDAVMPLIEKYIGSLPKRERSAKHLDKLRKYNRANGPLVGKVDVETVTPKAMVMATFVGPQAQNVYETRAMNLTSRILSSVVIKRIREELGLVYSIQASNQPDYAYENGGMFMSGAPCDPENAQRVVDEIYAIYQDFATNGPTKEQLDNAKLQVANDLDTNLREPSFWFSILTNMDLHKRKLDDVKNIGAAYESFTAEQVRDVFAKYYVPEGKLSVIAVPTSPVSPEEDKAKAAKTVPAS